MAARRNSRAAIAIALALCAACAKKKDEAKVDPKVASPAPVVAPARPLPPSKPGPAYFAMGDNVVRYDAEGWTRLASGLAGSPQFAPALGPHIVIEGSSVQRLKGDALVTVSSPTEAGISRRVNSVAVAADGTIWGLADGKVVRAAEDVFVVDPFTSDDPPRGLAIARDGMVWLHTLDRTYARSQDATWRPVDVPNVTGQVADILQIAAHPQGDLYLLTSIGLYYRTADTWAPIKTGLDNELVNVIPGPGDRLAVMRRNRQMMLGTSRGVADIESKDVRITRFDAAGRMWRVTGDGIRVWLAGDMLRFWRTDETPGGVIHDILVVDGGPPVKVGERARGKVTGKIEGSAAGVEVVACSSSGPGYNQAPCEGVDNARRTTTLAGGRFTLDDVPVAPMRFWVKRGRWRDTDHAACCEALRPDATLDIGMLRLR